MIDLLVAAAVYDEVSQPVRARAAVAEQCARPVQALGRAPEQPSWTYCAVNHGSRHPSLCGECGRDQEHHYHGA